jgi:hypothetical protein
MRGGLFIAVRSIRSHMSLTPTLTFERSNAA